MGYKVDRIEIKPNDDGSYQVECCGCDENKNDGMCGGYERKSYSAKDLSEAFDKTKKAISEMESMESGKKKKKDDSVEKFMGVEKDED